MSRPSHPIDPEALLEHLDWVRSLARRLVNDPGLAEDLTQETCLRALDAPGPRADRVQGWLATILRNLAHRIRRRDAHRLAAEEAAARREPSQDSPELVSEVVEHRAIVDHLLALQEPYRTTLLLRYYEGLTPTLIAERQGLAIATVKTRLRRGLQTLRARVGRPEEERRTFGLWFAMLLDRGADRITSASANTQVAFAVAASAALVCAMVAVGAGSRGADPVHAIGRGAARAPGEGATVRLAHVDAPADRDALHSIDPETDAPEVVETRVLNGRVVDLRGRGVAGAPVEFVPTDGGAERTAHADSDGGFTITTRDVDGRVESRSESHVAVLHAVVHGRAPNTSLALVVAERGELRGFVVDEDGNGIAHASIAYIFDRDVRADLELVFDQSYPSQMTTTTGQDGSFRLVDVPSNEAGIVRIESIGFHVLRDPVRLEGGRGPTTRTITMRRIRSSNHVALGVVLDARGEPIDDAWVAVGRRASLTDAQGRFQLAPRQGEVRPDIVAVAPGYLPARIPVPEIRRSAEHGNNFYAELTLDRSSGEVSGRAFAGGEPVAGARVDLVGGESYALTWSHLPGGMSWHDTTIESISAGARLDVYARTAEDGSFVASGLQPGREYSVLVTHPTDLRQVASDTFRAGDAELRLDFDDAAKDEVTERLAGVVRLTSGEVPEGTSVVLRRVGVEPNTDGRGTLLDPIVVECDADGRFDFGSVCTKGAWISPVGLGLATEWSRVDELDGPRSELRLAALRECFVRVSVRSELGAVRFRVEDERGDAVPLTLRSGHRVDQVWRTRLDQGASASTHAVSERARFIVLEGEDERMLRLPVTPAPGEVVTVTSDRTAWPDTTGDERSD